MISKGHDRASDPTTPLIGKTRHHQYEQLAPSPCSQHPTFRTILKYRSAKVAASIISLGSALIIICVLLSNHGPQPLTSCLENANVHVVTKGSKNWDEAILPWNDRVKFTPAAVAIPQSIDQIQAALSCGIRSQARVTAKCGGHSFGSYGLGGEDGHLVIDLQQMYKVTLHNDNHTAWIQPGARLGHVSVELYNQGRRAIPHGACPGVGLAGHVLHGGYGRASRTHGLTLDWLIGAKVILSNGTMVYCSEKENSDLFWALRGAGASFGIVAEFEFNTFEAPDHVTPFTIELPWSEENAIESISAIQGLSKTAPKELNMFLFVTATSQVIQGMYFGDENGLRQALQPLLARLKTQLSYARAVGWLEGLEHYADGEELDQTYPYDVHGTFYTTSLTTPALTDEQINSLVSALFSNIHNSSARHSWDIFFEMHGGERSAVAQIDPSATAYVHRDKLLLWQLSDSGSHSHFPNEGFAVLKRFMDSVTNFMADENWGMYANFIDTELDGETAQRLYWGDNLPRLRGIKAKLDPGNMFWSPQGISISP